MTAYEDQIMQIAAYDNLYFVQDLGPSRIGVNVFISTNEPGRVEATWYDWKQLKDAAWAFDSAHCLWRFLKGYDPRIETKETP